MQSDRYVDLKHKLTLHNASYTFRYVTPHNIHRINIWPKKKKIIAVYVHTFAYKND